MSAPATRTHPDAAVHVPPTAARSAFSPRDAGLLVVLALLWGNSFLFIKFAVEAIPPLWVVAGRLTVGGALLGVIAALRRQRLPRTPGMLLILGVIGASTAGGWLAQAWAQQQLDSGLVAVLNATTPVMTLVVAVALRQERLHVARVGGLAVAIAGTVVVIGGEIQAGGPALALAAAALATFGYAVSGVLTRARVSGRVATVPGAGTQLLLGAVVINAAALVTDGLPPAPTDIPAAAALSLLALGLLGTGVAFLIFYRLIGTVGATNASMVTYLVPIVGLISGAIVRGERFGLNVLVGAAVLIGGVYLAQRNPDAGSRPAVAATAAPHRG